MLFDRVAVALLRAGAQVQHGPGQPLGCGIGEPQPTVGNDALPAAATSEQLVPQRPRGRDPTDDCAPALFTGTVLEADLVHARRTAVDVALDPDSARG